MDAFSNFLKVNGLKRKQIAEFLDVSPAFISQITSGDRSLPPEQLAKIKQNTFGWDYSMLLSEPQNESDVQMEKLIAVYKRAFDSEEKTFIGYLLKQIEDKDILICELYKKIGMLETKLELARKGEIASVATGSSDVNAV